jgi:hypothetical protein
MMFLWLAQIALSWSKWPVSYRQTGVTINSSSWEFARSQIADEVFSYNGTGFFANDSFYVRMFEPLSPSSLPYKLDWEGFGLNAAWCYIPDSKCYVMSTIYDYTWTPKNDDNLSWGVIYESAGEPSYVNGVWIDWEVEAEFSCNEEGPEQAPEWVIDTTSGLSRIILRWNGTLSCPTITEAPTPTPTVSFDCKHTWRSKTEENYGLDIDLEELNNGDIGYSAVVVDRNLTTYILFFQPCERIVPCPWGAECDSQEESMPSAYICTVKNETLPDKCKSLGTWDEHTEPHLVNESNLHEGFYWDLQPDVKSLKHAKFLTYCRPDYPEGHLWVDVASIYNESEDEYVVRLFGSSACPRSIPSPGPQNCDLSAGTENWTLNLNLTMFGPQGPITMAREDLYGYLYDVWYEPCRGMACPTGYDCQGDEDAFLWICELENLTHPNKLCTAYGLHKNNVSMGLNHEGDIFSGVVARYRGDKERQAHIVWNCSESVPAGTVLMPDRFTLNWEEIVQFTVQSQEACPKGSGPTPPPGPTHMPVVPTPPAWTPTPLANPDPYYYLVNDTHYIVLDLEHGISQTWPLIYESEVSVDGYHSPVRVEWRPWMEMPCPENMVCPEGAEANLWICWDAYGTTNWYCHPVSNREIPGSKIDYAMPGQLENGVFFTYNGWYNVRAMFACRCDAEDPSVWPWEFPIQNVWDLMYVNEADKATFLFADVYTQHACPRPFAPLAMPTTPMPTPSGEPRRDDSINWTDGTVTLGINLHELGSTASANVIKGVQGIYSKIDFEISWVNPITCPRSNCGVYANDKAHIWECIDAGQCFPASGDERFERMISWRNAGNPWAGIVISYFGKIEGLGYYTAIFLDHNESMQHGQIVFKEICRATEGGSVVLNAWTNLIISGPGPTPHPGFPTPTPRPGYPTPSHYPGYPTPSPYPGYPTRSPTASEGGGPTPSRAPTGTIRPSRSPTETRTPTLTKVPTKTPISHETPSPTESAATATSAPGPNHRESAKGGSIFLLVVGGGLVVYLIIAVLVGFLCYGQVSVGPVGFWSEFGACVATAVTFIFTCGRHTWTGGAGHASGQYETL